MPIECRERWVLHTEQYCPTTGQEWVFDSECSEYCPTNCIACPEFEPDLYDDTRCCSDGGLTVHKEPK